MPSTKQPSSPSDDLAARIPWRAPDGALAPELSAFCERGLSVCLASSDSRCEPIAGLGLACRQDEAALRVFLGRRGNERLLEALAAGAPIAVTFTQPETHRSIQLKATSASIAPLLPADEPHLARQSAAMRDELISVGYSTTFASVYADHERHDLVVIVLAPDRAFVQTPGPAAGSALP